MANKPVAADNVTGVFPAVVEKRLPTVLNAAGFGADKTGATDSTAALQSWLNAVTTTPAMGVLPPGNYKITDWLTIPTTTERWQIHAPGVTITQFTANKGHFRFTRQGTWGFRIGGGLHLTWNTAQTSSNTLAIAVAFDTDGTPAVDGNGYYNFVIDGLRLSNGFRGIAQYADSTTAAVWGADIQHVHSNSSMVGSTIRLRSTNGAPNVTLRDIYVRADNITEQPIYVQNISGGLGESIEINNSVTSQEIEIQNSDSIVLKNIRSEDARNASGVTVEQECNLHGLIEFSGSRGCSVEGFTIQNKQFKVNGTNGRNLHYGVRAISSSTIKVSGVVAKGVTVNAVSFAAHAADSTSRITYDQLVRVSSPNVYPVDPFNGTMPMVFPLGAVPLTWYIQNLTYFLPDVGAAGTSNTLGNGNLRLVPFVVPRMMQLAAIGAEVFGAGDAGCTFRLGIYSDAGGASTGYPGNLRTDAGTIAADSTGMKEVASTVILEPGIYWIGGAVQGVTVNQPTMRTVNQAAAIQIGISGTPSAGDYRSCWQLTGQTGALASSFGGGLGSASTAPRIHIKIGATG